MICNRQLFFPLAFLFLWSSCTSNNGKIEGNIRSQIKRECEGEKCVIDISQSTRFKWKKFYYFTPDFSLKEIEKELDQPYPFYDDVGRRLVFLDQENRIVYHEDIFPTVERYPKDVVFQMPDSVSYRVYTSPVFEMRKYYLNDDEYFYLLDQK